MVHAGPADPHDLRFCDLGPLALQINGEDRSPGGRRPTAALILLLINANRRVSADALREAMWGSATSSRAASTLETNMFRLRKVVEPGRRPGQPPTVVISEPGGYRVVVAPDQVDSIRFAQLAVEVTDLLRTGQSERARRKSEEALGLWRGRPFDVVADEVWAAAAVARLEEAHIQLLEGHIEALLGCSEPERALLELEPMLAEHPYRERLWLHRMLAVYRCGRAEEALEIYQEVRRRFLDELGVEPGPELGELQASVLAGDADRLGRRSMPLPSPVAAAGPVTLPRRAGALFGRADELAQIRQLCSTAQLVTVTGAGGCGKTRLAIEAARELGAEFVDGVWFVDLTTVQADDEVAQAIVSALNLAPAAAGLPADLLRSFVRDRRMLIVLDNCEHVVEGAADLVDALLAPGSELALLATSREPLQIAGEVVFALGPLAVPPEDDGPMEQSELAASPAVQLFVARIGGLSIRGSATDQLDDELTEEMTRELAVVAQICRAVDGIPLAVELAAARVRAFSLVEIAQQVAGDPTALGQLRRGVPAHQQSLKLAVDWSHRMLTPAEQLVHRRIAIIQGGFTAAAAAAVCGLGVTETESVLVGLVHKSMVVALGPARPGAPSRFTQLVTIRAHGRQELSTCDEAEKAVRERDRWVVDLVYAKPRTGHWNEPQWFNRVEDDLACVRGTLHDTLRERKDPVGAFVVGRLTLFWYFRGLVSEAGRWYALSRDVVDAPAIDRALVAFGLAAERALAQRMDVARPLIAEGLRIGAERAADQDVVFGEALVQLAGGVMLAGDQPLAADLARRALWIAEQHDNALLALTARARLAMNPDDPSADSAPDIYRQAIEHQNHYAAHMAANGVTVRALARGDTAAGLQWSDRVIALNRRYDIAQAPVVLEIRANLLTLAGEPRDALRLYSAAQVHNRRAGLPWPSREATAGLLARATSQVDRTQFDAAWRAGRQLTLDDVAPWTDGLTDGVR